MSLFKSDAFKKDFEKIPSDITPKSVEYTLEVNNAYYILTLKCFLFFNFRFYFGDWDH